MTTLYTIGFTKKSAKSFFMTLTNNGVSKIIDIRLNNVSQLAGFTKKDDLEFFLDKICHAKYLHMPILAPTKGILDAYKDKIISWQEYEKQYNDLISSRNVEKRINQEILADSCFLCSEPTPEQCHRRLAAEYFKRIYPGIRIVHL